MDYQWDWLPKCLFLSIQIQYCWAYVTPHCEFSAAYIKFILLSAYTWGPAFLSLSLASDTSKKHGPVKPLLRKLLFAVTIWAYKYMLLTKLTIIKELHSSVVTASVWYARDRGSIQRYPLFSYNVSCIRQVSMPYTLYHCNGHHSITPYGSGAITLFHLSSTQRLINSLPSNLYYYFIFVKHQKNTTYKHDTFVIVPHKLEVLNIFSQEDSILLDANSAYTDPILERRFIL